MIKGKLMNRTFRMAILVISMAVLSVCWIFLIDKAAVDMTYMHIQDGVSIANVILLAWLIVEVILLHRENRK